VNATTARSPTNVVASHCGRSLTDHHSKPDPGVWPLGSFPGGHAGRHGHSGARRNSLGRCRSLRWFNQPNQHRFSGARRSGGSDNRGQHRLLHRSVDWSSLGRAIRQICAADRVSAEDRTISVSTAWWENCFNRKADLGVAGVCASACWHKPNEMALLSLDECHRRDLLGFAIWRGRLPVRGGNQTCGRTRRLTAARRCNWFGPRGHFILSAP